MDDGKCPCDSDMYVTGDCSIHDTQVMDIDELLTTMRKLRTARLTECEPVLGVAVTQAQHDAIKEYAVIPTPNTMNTLYGIPVHVVSDNKPVTSAWIDLRKS